METPYIFKVLRSLRRDVTYSAFLAAGQYIKQHYPEVDSITLLKNDFDTDDDLATQFAKLASTKNLNNCRLMFQRVDQTVITSQPELEPCFKQALEEYLGASWNAADPKPRNFFGLVTSPEGFEWANEGLKTISVEVPAWEGEYVVAHVLRKHLSEAQMTDLLMRLIDPNMSEHAKQRLVEFIG